MSKELTTFRERELTPEQVNLIKNTVCKGATNDELALFLYTAKRTGLDPLARQIHAVKRWDSVLGREVMAIQTGIDGYRLVADRTHKYAPGDIELLFDSKGGLLGATACVKKLVEGTWIDVKSTAYFDEYVQKKKDGTFIAMWKKMPRVMISKCAEALALRRAFPAELSGVYTEDELGQDVGGGLKEPKAKTTEPKQVTPQAEKKDAIPGEVVKRDEQEAHDQFQDEDPNGTAQGDDDSKVPPPPAPGDKVINDKQGKRLYAKWKSAEKTDAEVRAYLKKTYGYGSTRDIKDGEEYDAICVWAEDKSTTEPK